MACGDGTLERRGQYAGGTALLVLLLAASILGGEHPQISLAVLVLAGGCLAWRGAGEGLPFAARERIWAITLAAAAILAGLQLLPLPPGYPGGEFRAALDADLAAAGAPAWRRWSLDPAGTIRGITGLAMVAGSWLAARRLSETDTERVILFVIALGTALAGWAIAESLGKPDTTGADATFAHRNQLAGFMAMAIPLASAVAANQRAAGLIRWFAAIGAALLLLGALLTYSRAGSVLAICALAASVGFMLKQRLVRSMRHTWFAALAALGTTIFFIALAFDKLAARWTSPAGDDQRWRMAELGIDAASDLWPWGGGLGSFRWVYQGREAEGDLAHATHAAYAHNELVQIAVEMGLAGMLLALSLVVVVSLGGVRAWRCGSGLTFPRAAAVSAAIPLLHSLVDAPLRAPACAVLMGLVLAILLREPEAGRTLGAASRQFR